MIDATVRGHIHELIRAGFGRMTTYSERLKALLTADERAVFARLNSPHKVQDFVDRVRVNLEETGETIL